MGNYFNGFVYVTVLQKCKHRTEISHNLKSDIPNIKAEKIIDHLKPYLQQQQYYSALHLLELQESEVLNVQTSLAARDLLAPAPHTTQGNSTTETWKQSQFE